MRIPFAENAFWKVFSSVTIFVLIAAFVPVLGALALFLLPMVIFYHAVINGILRTSIAFLLSFSLFLLAAFLLKMNIPWLVVFTLSLSGLFIAKLTTQDVSVEKTVIYPTLFLMAAIGTFIVHRSAIHSMLPWDLVVKYVTIVVQENIKFYQKLPLKKEDITFVVDHEKDIIQSILQAFPAIIAIFSAFIIWTNLLLAKKLLLKAGVTFSRLGHLCLWKASDVVIWFFIGSGGLIFIHNKALNFLGVNVFLITCFVYFLQGLAIVSYIFQIKNVPLLWRYLFYFFIAVQQFLMIPVIALGLFDTWFDFRKYFQNIIRFFKNAFII